MAISKHVGGVCFLDWNSLASKVSSHDDQRYRDTGSRRFVSSNHFIFLDLTAIYTFSLLASMCTFVEKSRVYITRCWKWSKTD
jgi:hypothetical protein